MDTTTIVIGLGVWIVLILLGLAFINGANRHETPQPPHNEED